MVWMSRIIIICAAATREIFCKVEVEEEAIFSWGEIQKVLRPWIDAAEMEIMSIRRGNERDFAILPSYQEITQFWVLASSSLAAEKAAARRTEELQLPVLSDLGTLSPRPINLSHKAWVQLDLLLTCSIVARCTLMHILQGVVRRVTLFGTSRCASQPPLFFNKYHFQRTDTAFSSQHECSKKVV